MIIQSRWNRLRGPIGLGLAALLLLPAAASAQNQLLARSQTGPPGYQGREEGETIDIDLEEAAFATSLPFDVAFKVKGPMPETFDAKARLDARFVEFNRVPDCLALFGQFQVSTDSLSDLEAIDDIPVRQRRPTLPVESSGFSQAEVFIGGRTIESIPLGTLVQLGSLSDAAAEEAQKASFLVDFPALRPNRYYCFQFISRRQLAGQELTDLQSEFASTVDAELRKERYQKRTRQDGGEATIFQDSEYQALRDTLTALIESKLTRPGQVVLAPRGSFFDIATPLAGIGAPYRRQFEDIAEMTVDTRIVAIRNFEADVELAVASLRRIGELNFALAEGEEPISLQAVLSGTEVEAVRTRLQEIQSETGVDLLALLGLSAASQRDVVSGAGADAAAPPDLRNVWDPAAVGEWVQNIKELEAAVGQLDDLAELAGYDAAFFAGADAAEGDDEFEELGEGDAATRARAAQLEGEDTGDDTFVDQAVTRLGAAADNLGQLQRTLAARLEAISAWVGEILVEERKSLVVGASTIAKYDTRAIWYMSADLGAGISPDTEDLFTYVGWNIYFRPVNKKSHLSWKGRPFGLKDEFLRRFSVTLGIVQDGFEEEDPLFKGVIGNNAAVLGAGFRINDSIRLSVGGLVFENENPDPLISSTTLNWAPYAAISFDWNATATIAGLFANQ